MQIESRLICRPIFILIEQRRSGDNSFPLNRNPEIADMLLKIIQRIGFQITILVPLTQPLLLHPFHTANDQLKDCLCIS